ncbi:hypothetical protein Bbelb_233720 [Branchiostoma belcheri]|nr:hypothetical protein Bbelb_233720 [Branchiostoma belcheri]
MGSAACRLVEAISALWLAGDQEVHLLLAPATNENLVSKEVDGFGKAGNCSSALSKQESIKENPSLGNLLNLKMSDGGLFNLARLKSQRHVLVKCIRELLYADDSALVAHTLDSIQRLLEKFAEAARAYGMTINIKKTEVLYQPAPGKPHIPPQVLLDGTPLAEAETFTYLGSTVSNDNSMDSEIDARRRAASAAFGRLKDRLWNVKSIRLNTKLNVYRAVVLSALLYGLEVSTLYARHVRQLSVLVQRHLRGLMGITWQDRISNVEVLRRAGMPAMEAMITRSQLRWTGHVIRMSEERLPRDLLYSELREGSRPRGRPRLRYKDTLKRRLGLAGISHQQLETLPFDRAGWRAVVRKSAEAVHREWEHREDKRASRRHAATATKQAS